MLEKVAEKVAQNLRKLGIEIDERIKSEVMARLSAEVAAFGDELLSEEDLVRVAVEQIKQMRKHRITQDNTITVKKGLLKINCSGFINGRVNSRRNREKINISGLLKLAHC